MLVKVYRHKDFPNMFFFKEEDLQEFIKFIEAMKIRDKEFQKKVMYNINTKEL